MMKNLLRKNDGYTLLELLTTMVTASIVTLAAVTILFLGVRINRQSMDTASRQMTTRILMSSLEDLAAEGSIDKVASDMLSWQVMGTDEAVLYAYDSEKQTISSGQTAILEGVISSEVELKEKLLTVTVTTEDGTYTSSVYCRMNEVEGQIVDSSEEKVDDILDSEGVTGETQAAKHRREFLQKLAGQYAITINGLRLKNPGLILDDSGESTGKYFSQWYATDMRKATWGYNGWNADTPWCACFVSWGLYQVMDANAPCYANVDSFMTYLKNSSQWKDAAHYRGGYTPVAGDLIFFDWKINNVRDPEHVGAVVKVADETVNGQNVRFVYTIEGNSSSRVAIRKYRIDDPRIIGYGVLWPAA